MPRSRQPALRSILLGSTLLLAASLLAGLPTPAEASDSPHSVVVTADPADWTPQIRDGQVNAIVQIGTKVVVGGTFHTVRKAGTSQDLTRNFIFAFDMNTGTIDPNFTPQLNDQVLALTRGPDNASVFVGGLFSTVNGATYRNLVRLRLSDGQSVSTFKANTNSRVQDLDLNNGWLYVSGKFTMIKSTPRSGLARLNPDTGAVDANLDLPFTNPLNGTLGVPEIDVSNDGTRLVAIGSFSKVAGLDRVQVAMLDLTTTPATVSSWQTSDYPVFVPNTTTTWCSSSFDTYLRSVKISPDNAYFVIATTGAFRATRLCDTSSRWELSATGPNQHPTWVDWTGGDTTWSVSITGAAIYTGGHYRWQNNPYRGDAAGPGAVPREGIAALDPLTGLPFSWDPGHERGVGIFAMPATPDGLWAGSDTDHTAGEFHQKIAFYPVNGGFMPPPIVTYTLPGNLYNMSQSNGALNVRSYDGTALGTATTVPGVDWTTARGAFMLSGRLYYGMNDGTLRSRTFDGTNLGPQTTLNLNGLGTAPPTTFTIPGTSTPVPTFTSDLTNMTGMFYDRGRIYYTVNKSNATTTNNMLFYRYFNPESGIVGANLFVASAYPADGAVQWSNVRGMTLASGKLTYALTDGRLYRIDWNSATGKPTGSVTQISSATTWQSRGMFVYNPSQQDVTPPTVPGKPTAKSPSAGVVKLTWPASTDASAITYRIYRDGGATPIGQSTGTSYTDTGLAVGSTHTYRVDAIDASNNPSTLSSASDPIQVTDTIFVDDFTGGNFAAWTNTTGPVSIDTSQGSPGAPSARIVANGQAAYADQDFEFTYPSVCASVNANVTSLGTNSVDLFRLRSATGGAIAKVFVTSAGLLVVRSDFGSVQQNSGVAIGSGWHNVELCGTVGAASTWDLYRDGVKIVNAFNAATGTAAIGRIQLGDTTAKTQTINYDHVRVDVAPGEPTANDTTPPTVPGEPTGSSSTTTSIALSWGASFDDSPPITYRIYRDGGGSPISSTTNTTYTDAGLAAGSTHTYAVDAVDSKNNASAKSPTSDPITVLAQALFADDFSSNDFTNWTTVTRLTIDGTQGGGGAPSARGNPAAQSAFAARDLATTFNTACFRVNVNATSLGGNAIDLFRLRSATNGPIIKAFVTSTGTLAVRSDFASTQQATSTALGLNGWHTVELCGTVGGTWDLYRDGVRILQGFSAATGSDPIGRVQIGDNAAKTWTANFDDVRLDTTPGQ